MLDELKSRFDHFAKTGDDSKIPADLQNIIFSTAIKYGDAAEYDAVVRAHDKPKTPMQKIAAMLAFLFLAIKKSTDLCATIRIAFGNAQKPELIQRTFDAISTKARDQDIMYYFVGLAANVKTRRLLVNYFQDHYTEVWVIEVFLPRI